MPARLLGGASLLDLRSAAGVLAVVKGLLVWVGLQSLRFAPLGFLAVFALPDREGRLARTLRVALPAAGVALVLAALALGARAGFSVPGPFELLLPAAGILLGVWAGLAWRRGWWSRLFFLPKLAAVGALVVLGGLALAVLALEPEPAVAEAAPIASADKRHLVGLFRGRDPRKVPPGETRTVRLSAEELDQLVAWAASVGLKTRTSVSLRAGGAGGRGHGPGPGDRTVAQRDGFDARRHREGAALRGRAAPAGGAPDRAPAPPRRPRALRRRRAPGRPRPAPRPACRRVAVLRPRGGEPHLRAGGDAPRPDRAPRVGRGGERADAGGGLRPRRSPAGGAAGGAGGRRAVRRRARDRLRSRPRPVRAGLGDGGEPRRPARSRHRPGPPAARPGRRGEAGRGAVRDRLARERAHDPAGPRRLDAPLHGERRAHRGLRGRSERRGRSPQGGARRRRRQRVLLRRPAGRPGRDDLRERGHARRGVRRRHPGEAGGGLPRGRLLPAGRRAARGHPGRRAAVALRRGGWGRSTARPPRRSSGASPPAPPTASRPCARSRPSSTVGTRRKKGRRRRSPCSPPPRRRAPASRRPSGTASSTRPGGRASCSRSRGARTATAGPTRRSRPSGPRATRSRRCSPSACASTRAGRCSRSRRCRARPCGATRPSRGGSSGRPPPSSAPSAAVRGWRSSPRTGSTPPAPTSPASCTASRSRPSTPRPTPRPSASSSTACGSTSSWRRRTSCARGPSAPRGPRGTPLSCSTPPLRCEARRRRGWPRRWRASPRPRCSGRSRATLRRPSTSPRPSCSRPAAPAFRRASCTPASRSSRSASPARRRCRRWARARCCCATCRSSTRSAATSR